MSQLSEFPNQQPILFLVKTQEAIIYLVKNKAGRKIKMHT
jgi:hypothetical protein